ncbi:golgi complex component [Stachybotrys elegans]|uniref:Golgi complex component n=1 Tax=Stachybotrys elegans TaxID=80388 RepID=A0A8K0SW49_9HYPO|nr:golgi complex component [Stachybotrys elegans]
MQDFHAPSTGDTSAIANRYREILHDQHDTISEVSSTGGNSIEAPPRRAVSPLDSVMSGPDDTPSVQGSMMSSPSSSLLPSAASRPGLNSPTPSLRPFDRRFQSRISSYGPSSPRPSSPAFLHSHSRNASVSSAFILDQADTDTTTPPWEVVRWTRLKKLNGQAFSEAGRRNFGSPTCLAVSGSIVMGTSKGIILVFDYNQNLKYIIGPGTKAVESGPITAIAVSADHTTLAGGHANGSIFTWDTSRASRPFLTIPPLEEMQLQNRTADGHVSNVSVIHLGFLGTRHTALVSADDKGMAFSHLATRGTGALGRTVRTTRILGRYPNAPNPMNKVPKPSSVLAFAPLPLGDVERTTDTMGLTAMLTPYLLVIVSTTPVAQTQHKSARPKDVAAHSAMTGCLAWFPAVKLKVPDPHTGSDISKVKLAYCWSNVLTVLDVDEIPRENKDQPPSLTFKARSRWRCEEAIAAVQWLSRSVLTVLTISQRLIVVEDRSMRMTEAFDLLHKHVYHADLFSTQLHSLVEQLDEDDDSLHGVVADAFYMSFKAYKGRMFLLGFSEVSIGALSNWADRLIAMMENGDYIGAIQLATSYFTGDADKLTIGLPEDMELRHSMVRDRIMEIVSTSLRYAFNQRQKRRELADDAHLKQLAETCFTACESVGNIDYLFDEMYDHYESGNAEGIFLETLEPYILAKTITAIPPAVVKDLVNYYVTKGWETRLEEMICFMETATLDLDQITLLCKQHSLYDALIYVWNQALNDYITPMIDLLSLLIPSMTSGGSLVQGGDDDYYSINVVKIFPYLSFTLTGRVYPNEEPMDDDKATKAKAEIYWFLFSGKTIEWPRGGNREFRILPNSDSQPSFPYLRLILKYDAASFLSALNEAFEDSFLNDSPDGPMRGSTRGDLPEEQVFGLTINRQYIVSILLDVMNRDEFSHMDLIYLDMFIARNLPKFPQYLLFSGSTLSKVLEGLCNYPGEEIAEDAQLSAEYLLSIYQPTDMSTFIPMFRKAGFYRILKRIYKQDKQYLHLIDAYFEDIEDQEMVFDCLADCLRPHAALNSRQLREVQQAIEAHARDLLDLDAYKTAVTLASQDKSVHQVVLESAADAEEVQYIYLKSLLETSEKHGTDGDLIERYIQLMCQFDPGHVSDYIETRTSVDLRLDNLLPVMENQGVVDAAVVLMAREGQVKEAMDRLIKHLGTLESAMQGLLSGQIGTEDRYDGEEFDLQSAAEDLLHSLQKYVYVGIWLCQGQTKTSRRSNAKQGKNLSATSTLSADEMLWLDLIDSCAQMTRRLSPLIEEALSRDNVDTLDGSKLLALLRSLVQHTFTSLLTSTSSQANVQNDPRLLSNARSNLSFLRILRAFLNRAAAASPSLADLRGVLASIFAAYAYEESILRLSNRLLDRSLFVSVSRAVELRQRGWRPRGSTCEACGRRVWGPGVAGGSVFEAWEDRQAAEEAKRKEKKRIAAAASGSEDGGKGKGKSPALRPETAPAEPTAGDDIAVGVDTKGKPMGPLVVLACRHIYHQSCLDAIREKEEDYAPGKEYRCPIDGPDHVHAE